MALRAAFHTVQAGKQVAVLTPTTLLARQHLQTFSERFARQPVTIAQLSRLVGTKEQAATRRGIASGEIDIVIGTHALLGPQIAFNDLGLVVVDEEQHFGVAHKERLKRLRAEAHVLTLTATPIPRTLQMALSGVRDMSVIATPPVDRLAVRTFILPYDPVVVREALMREHLRGGQTFYVCPRIADLDEVAERVSKLVPEVKVAIAHGRLAARALDTIMGDFYDGKIDVLVSTAIIESGLDLQRVNTMIVHRADRFGLAQLYQLRGRIGRAKLRGYAYLTLPPGHRLTDTAHKRLQVIHRLDGLGAGFSLASHDLDIRGAGNLLGAEQSGHIREVGIELYQHMLEEAVATARARAGGEAPPAERWSPTISLGTAVLIPRELRARPRRAPHALSPGRGAGGPGRHRRLRRRADRPLRPAARIGAPPAGDHGDQAALPAKRHRAGRGGAQGRGAELPRGRLPPTRRRWSATSRRRRTRSGSGPTAASSRPAAGPTPKRVWKACSASCATSPPSPEVPSRVSVQP